MPDWLPATVAVLLSAVVLGRRIGAAHTHNVEHFDRQVNHLRKVIIVTAQDTVNAVVAQLNKVRLEVTSARDALNARIVELQEQIEAGVPAEELDLAELSAAAQALDDIVPDAPVVVVDEDEPQADVPADDVPVDVPVDVPADDAPTDL